MADVKITALTAISANPVNPATFPMPMVDLLDNTITASGTTKKVTVNQILGAGGTATLASATITGAATVGTTLGVTGASTLASANISGLLGVGTVSPDASFKATLSGLYGLRVQSADTNNSAINFGSDTAAGYSFIDTTKTGSGSFLPLRLSTSDIERLRIETAGDVTISTGNVVMATSGKGIDFAATASGSGTMTSELLNDYEEGTWDASFISAGGTVTINTSSNRCRYTKIGRLVTVHGLIEVSSVSSPTGNLIISGLPFTIATATEGDTYSAASICGDLLEVTAIGQIVGFGSPNSTSIYLYRYQAGALIGLAPSAKAYSQFFFTLTYSV